MTRCPLIHTHSAPPSQLCGVQQCACEIRVKGKGWEGGRRGGYILILDSGHLNTFTSMLISICVILETGCLASSVTVTNQDGNIYFSAKASESSCSQHPCAAEVKCKSWSVFFFFSLSHAERLFLKVRRHTYSPICVLLSLHIILRPKMHLKSSHKK